MGQLVKKQTTVWVDEKGKRCKSDHPHATKKTITSKKWYANITAENGKRKSIPLSKGKGVSKTMFAKAEHDIQLRKLGIRNTITDAEEKPLETHLERIAWASLFPSMSVVTGISNSFDPNCSNMAERKMGSSSGAEPNVINGSFIAFRCSC